MAGFNIVGQIQLTGPTNLGAVVSQIKTQLSGISAQINLNLSGATISSITSANTALQQFNSTIQQLVTGAAGASTALSGLSSAMGRVQGGTGVIVTSNRAATQSYKQLTQATVEGISATEEFGKTAGLALRRFSGFSVAAGGVFGLIAAFKSGVSEALIFEREMVKLVQVGAGTQQQIEGIAKEISRLSTTLGVSSKDLSQASVLLAAAGYNANQVTTALEALAKAALSPSFGNMNDSVNGLIAIMAQFKYGTNDAERALGAINAVSNAFSVESKDLIEAVKRTGGAFRSSGGDFNQFLALFTSIRSTTRESADAIATGLRTVFTRFQRPETVQQLRELGINLRYTREEAVAMGNTGLERQFVGPYEAVRRLNAALKDVPTTDPRYAAIVESLGGYRQVSRVIPLIQEFNLAQRAYVTAQSGANSVTTAADQAQAAFLVRLTAVKEQFFELFRMLVGSSAFKTMLDGILTVTSALIKLGDVLAPLLPLITTLFTIKIAAALPAFLAGFFGGASGATPKRVASGGHIPGSGNSDTVPAMLTPGEFVIRKSAASSLGSKVLEHMNRTGGLPTQRFAGGGQVLDIDQLLPTRKPFVSMLTYEDRPNADRKVVVDRGVRIGKEQFITPTSHAGQVLSLNKAPEGPEFYIGILSNLRNQAVSTNDFRNTSPNNREAQIATIREFIRDSNSREALYFKSVGIDLFHGAAAILDSKYSNILPSFLNTKGVFAERATTYRNFITQSNPYLIPSTDVGPQPSPGHILQRDIKSFALTVRETSPNPSSTLELSKGSQGATFDNTVSRLIRSNVIGLATLLSNDAIPNISKGRADNIIYQSFGNDLNKFSGRIFDAANKLLANSLSGTHDTFDFTPRDTTVISRYYRGDISGSYGDAKFHGGDDPYKSLVSKTIRQFGIVSSDGSIPSVDKEQLLKSSRGVFYPLQKGPKAVPSSLPLSQTDITSFRQAGYQFAIGGVVPGVGNSDTVPALLTPGEFVIRKNSAQQIGYDTLSSLNEGGAARFAEGGSVVTKENILSILKEFKKTTGIDFSKIVSKISIDNDDEFKGFYITGSGKDKRGKISLSKTKIKTLDDLRFVLAHELGHGVDAFLGKGDYASDDQSSIVSKYGKMHAKTLKERDNQLYYTPERGTFRYKYSENYKKYRYGKDEAFADLFAERLVGVTDEGERGASYRGFDRKILESVAAQTNSNYTSRNLGVLGNLARRPVLGFIPRLFGFGDGGAIQNLQKFAVGGAPQFFSTRDLDPTLSNIASAFQIENPGLQAKKQEEYSKSDKSKILKVPFGNDRFGMIFMGAAGDAGLNSQALVPIKRTKLGSKLYDSLINKFENVFATFDKHVASVGLTTDFNQKVTEKLRTNIEGTLQAAIPDGDSLGLDLKLSKQQMATITGPVFEKYLSALIKVPLDTGSNAVFDFTDPKLQSSKINEMVFPALKTSLIDVKSSGHGENVYSVVGKYLNYKNNQGGIPFGNLPTSEGTEVSVAAPQAGSGRTRRSGGSGGSGGRRAVDNSEAERIRREAESIGLAEIIRRPITGFNRGGSTDTVPALLTPGEFIMSRGAVSRIGSANLSYMNITGKLPGYNSGGLVQKFAFGDIVKYLPDVSEKEFKEASQSVLLSTFLRNKGIDESKLPEGVFAQIAKEWYNKAPFTPPKPPPKPPVEAPPPQSAPPPPQQPKFSEPVISSPFPYQLFEEPQSLPLSQEPQPLSPRPVGVPPPNRKGFLGRAWDSTKSRLGKMWSGIRYGVEDVLYETGLVGDKKGDQKWADDYLKAQALGLPEPKRGQERKGLLGRAFGSIKRTLFGPSEQELLESIPPPVDLPPTKPVGVPLSESQVGAPLPKPPVSSLQPPQPLVSAPPQSQPKSVGVPSQAEIVDLINSGIGGFELNKLLTNRGLNDDEQQKIFRVFNKVKIPVSTVPPEDLKELQKAKDLFRSRDPISGEVYPTSAPIVSGLPNITKESQLPFRIDEHKKLIEAGIQNQAKLLAQRKYVSEKQASQLPDLTTEQKIPILLSEEAKGKSTQDISILFEKEQRRLFVEEETKKQKAFLDKQFKDQGISHFTGDTKTGLSFFRGTPELGIEEARRKQEQARRDTFGDLSASPVVDEITKRTQGKIDKKGGSDVLSAAKQQELFEEQRKKVIQELITAERDRIKAVAKDTGQTISSSEALRLARENVANGLAVGAEIDRKGKNGALQFVKAQESATLRLNDLAVKAAGAGDAFKELVGAVSPKGGKFSQFFEKSGIGGEGSLIGSLFNRGGATETGGGGGLFGGGTAGRLAGLGAAAVGISSYLPQVISSFRPKFEDSLANAVDIRGNIIESRVRDNPPENLLYRRGEQVSGAVTSGATFGIAGAAIGLGFFSAIPAAIGAVKGLGDAWAEQEKQIKKVQLAKSLEYFASQLSDFNLGKILPTDEAIGKLNTSLQSSLVRFRADEAESRRGGFFSAGDIGQVGLLNSGPWRIRRDTRLALASEDRALRENLGPRLPELLQNQERITGEYLRQAGVRLASGGGSITNIRNDPTRFTAQVDEVFNRFLEANNGYGRTILEISARLRGIPLAEAERQLRQNITLQLRQNIISQQEIENRNQINTSIRNFTGIVQAIQATVVSLHEFQATTDLIADTLEGRFTAVKSNLGERASVSGGLDRRFFEETVEAVITPLGAHGDRLRTDINQVDNASRLLPGLLAQTASTRPLEDKEFGVRVGAQLRAAGFANEIITAITNNLDKMKPEELFQKLRQDLPGLSRELLKDFEPVRQAFIEVAKAIDEVTNQFRAGLQRNNTLIGSVQQAGFRVSDATLARERLQAESNAILYGRRSTPLDFISLQQQEAPFNARQAILAGRATGDRSFDVSEISRALARTIQQIQEQDVIQRRSPASEEGRNAAVRFAELTRTSQELQNALKNLTDTSARAAGIQERLSVLQQDRESRLSFGERFITSDTPQQSQIIRSIQLTQLAAQRGSVQGFADTDRRAIFELLNSLGSARVPGLGNRTGRDVREQLVSEYGGGIFRPTEGARTEEQTLRDRLQEMFRTREDAEQALYNNQRTLQNTFFERLTSSQTALLAGLERNLQVRQQDLIRTRFQETQAAIGPATERAEAAGRLREIIPGLTASSFNQIKNNIELFRQLSEQLTISRTSRNVEVPISDIRSGLRFTEGYIGGSFDINQTNARTLLERHAASLGLDSTRDINPILERTFTQPRLGRVRTEIANRDFTGTSTESIRGRDSALRDTVSNIFAREIANQINETRTRATEGAETTRGRIRGLGVHPSIIEGFERAPAEVLEHIPRFASGEEFANATQALIDLNTRLGELRGQFDVLGRSISALDTTINTSGGVRPAPTAPLETGVRTVPRTPVPRPAIPTTAPEPPPRVEAPESIPAELPPPLTRIERLRRFSDYNRERSSFSLRGIGHGLLEGAAGIPLLINDILPWSSGGLIPGDSELERASHRFARGTDIVPAMLTPGEYVINRSATQRHLPLLEAINRGEGSYLAEGGIVGRRRPLDARGARQGSRPVSIPVRTTSGVRLPEELLDNTTFTVEQVAQKFQNVSDIDLNQSVEQARLMMLNLLIQRRQTFGPQIASLPRAIASTTNNLVRAELTSRLSRMQDSIRVVFDNFREIPVNTELLDRDYKIGIISRLPRRLVNQLSETQTTRSAALTENETLSEAALKQRYQEQAVPFINALIQQSSRMIRVFNVRQPGEVRDDALQYWQGIFNRFSNESNYPRTPAIIQGTNASPPAAGVEPLGRRLLLNVLREASLGFVPLPQFNEVGGVALNLQLAGLQVPEEQRAILDERIRPQLARAALLAQVRVQDIEAQEDRILERTGGDEAALNPTERRRLLRLRQQRGTLQGQVATLTAQTITPQEIEREQTRRAELGQQVTTEEQNLGNLFTEIGTISADLDSYTNSIQEYRDITSAMQALFPRRDELRQIILDRITARDTGGASWGPDLVQAEFDSLRQQIGTFEQHLELFDIDDLTNRRAGLFLRRNEKLEEYNNQQNVVNDLRRQLEELSGTNLVQRRVDRLRGIVDTSRAGFGRVQDIAGALPQGDAFANLLRRGFAGRGVRPGPRFAGQPGEFTPRGPRTPEEWREEQQPEEVRLRRGEERERRLGERARVFAPPGRRTTTEIETDLNRFNTESPTNTNELNEAISERNAARLRVQQLEERMRGARERGATEEINFDFDRGIGNQIDRLRIEARQRLLADTGAFDDEGNLIPGTAIEPSEEDINRAAGITSREQEIRERREALLTGPEDIRATGIYPELLRARASLQERQRVLQQAVEHERMLRSLVGLNTGGPVPGFGNTDTVPAMLTPGEYVINAQAARRVGIENLDRINYFQRGGSVGKAPSVPSGTGFSFSAEGMTELASSLTTFTASSTGLSDAMRSFTAGANSLTEALNKFPKTIEGSFTHNINVVMNGLEVLSVMQTEMEDIAVRTAKNVLRKYIDDNMPDAGRPI